MPFSMSIKTVFVSIEALIRREISSPTINVAIIVPVSLIMGPPNCAAVVLGSWTLLWAKYFGSRSADSGVRIASFRDMYTRAISASLGFS